MTAIGWSSEKPQHEPVSISLQAQLFGRPSVQDSTAAASTGSVLWKVLSIPPSPHDSSSENKNSDVSREKDPYPSHNLSTSLPVFPVTTKLLPSLFSLPGQTAGDKNRPIPPQLTGTLSPTCSDSRPIQPKGSWGLVGEPVPFQGQCGH